MGTIYKIKLLTLFVLFSFVTAFSQNLDSETTVTPNLSGRYLTFNIENVNDSTYRVQGKFTDYRPSTHAFTADSVEVGMYYWSNNCEKWEIDSVGVNSSDLLTIRVKGKVGKSVPKTGVSAIIDYSDGLLTIPYGLEAPLYTCIWDDVKQTTINKINTVAGNISGIDSTTVSNDSTFLWSKGTAYFTGIAVSAPGSGGNVIVYKTMAEAIDSSSNYSLGDTIALTGFLRDGDGVSAQYKRVNSGTVPSGYSFSNSGTYDLGGGEYLIPIKNQRFHPVMWGADPTDGTGDDSDAFDGLFTFLSQSAIFPDSTKKIIESGYGEGYYYIEDTIAVTGGSLDLSDNIFWDMQGSTVEGQSVKAYNIDGTSNWGGSGVLFQLPANTKDIVIFNGTFRTNREHIPYRQQSEYDELICHTCLDTVRSDYDFEAASASGTQIPYLASSNLKAFDFDTTNDNIVFKGVTFEGFISAGDPSGTNISYRDIVVRDGWDGFNPSNCDKCLWDNIAIDRSMVGNGEGQDSIGLIHAFYFTGVRDITLDGITIKGSSGVGIRSQPQSSDSLSQYQGIARFNNITFVDAGRFELSHPSVIEVDGVNWNSIPNAESTLFRVYGAVPEGRKRHINISNLKLDVGNRPYDRLLLGIDQLTTDPGVEVYLDDWYLNGDSLQFQLMDYDGLDRMEINNIVFKGYLPNSTDKSFIKAELSNGDDILKIRNSTFNILGHRDDQSLFRYNSGNGTDSSFFYRQILDVKDITINLAESDSSLFLFNPQDSAITIAEDIRLFGDLDSYQSIYRDPTQIDYTINSRVEGVYLMNKVTQNPFNRDYWNVDKVFTVNSVSDILDNKFPLNSIINVKGNDGKLPATYRIESTTLGHTSDSIAVIPTGSFYALLDSDNINLGHFISSTGTVTHAQGLINRELFQKAHAYSFSTGKPLYVSAATYQISVNDLTLPESQWGSPQNNTIVPWDGDLNVIGVDKELSIIEVKDYSNINTDSEPTDEPVWVLYGADALDRSRDVKIKNVTYKFPSLGYRYIKTTYTATSGNDYIDLGDNILDTLTFSRNIYLENGSSTGTDTTYHVYGRVDSNTVRIGPSGGGGATVVATASGDAWISTSHGLTIMFDNIGSNQFAENADITFSGGSKIVTSTDSEFLENMEGGTVQFTYNGSRYDRVIQEYVNADTIILMSPLPDYIPYNTNVVNGLITDKVNLHIEDSKVIGQVRQIGRFTSNSNKQLDIKLKDSYISGPFMHFNMSVPTALDKVVYDNCIIEGMGMDVYSDGSTYRASTAENPASEAFGNDQKGEMLYFTQTTESSFIDCTFRNILGVGPWTNYDGLTSARDKYVIFDNCRFESIDPLALFLNVRGGLKINNSIVEGRLSIGGRDITIDNLTLRDEFEATTNALLDITLSTRDNSTEGIAKISNVDLEGANSKLLVDFSGVGNFYITNSSFSGYDNANLAESANNALFKVDIDGEVHFSNSRFNIENSSSSTYQSYIFHNRGDIYLNEIIADNPTKDLSRPFIYTVPSTAEEAIIDLTNVTLNPRMTGIIRRDGTTGSSTMVFDNVKGAVQNDELGLKEGTTGDFESTDKLTWRNIPSEKSSEIRPISEQIITTGDTIWTVNLVPAINIWDIQNSSDYPICNAFMSSSTPYFTVNLNTDPIVFNVVGSNPITIKNDGMTSSNVAFEGTWYPGESFTAYARNGTWYLGSAGKVAVYQVEDTSKLAISTYQVGSLVDVQSTGGRYKISSTNTLGASSLNTYWTVEDANGNFAELQKTDGRYNIVHLGAENSSYNVQDIWTSATAISSSSNEISIYYPDGEYLSQGTGVQIIDQYVHHYFDGGYINLDATSTSYEMVFDGEVNWNFPWVEVNDSDDNYARFSFRHSSFDQKVYDASTMYRWHLGSQTEDNRQRNDIYFKSILSNIENYVKNGGYVKLPSVEIEISPYTAPNAGVDYYHSINADLHLFSEGECTFEIFDIFSNRSDQGSAYFLQRGPGTDYSNIRVNWVFTDRGYDSYTPTYTTASASDQITLGTAILDAGKDWVDKEIHLSGGTLGDTSFTIISVVSTTVVQVDETIDIVDAGNAWLTDSYEDDNFSFMKMIGDVNGDRATASVKWGKGQKFVTKTGGSWSSTELYIGDILEITGPSSLDSLDVNKYIQPEVVQISADTAWISSTIPDAWSEASGTDALVEITSPSITTIDNSKFTGGFRRLFLNGTNNYAGQFTMKNSKVVDAHAVLINQARTPHAKATFLYNDFIGINSNIGGDGQVDDCCTNSTIIYGNPFNQIITIGNTLNNVMVHGFYGNRGSDDFDDTFFDITKYKRTIRAKSIFKDNVQIGYGNYPIAITSIGDIEVSGNNFQNGFEIEAGGNIYVENNTVSSYGDNYTRSLPSIHLKPRSGEGQIFMDNNQVFQRNSGVALRISRAEDSGDVEDVIENFTIISDSLDALPDAGNFVGGIQPYIVIKSPNSVRFDNLKIEGRDAADPYTHVFYIDSIAGLELVNSEITLADATGEYLYHNVDATYDFCISNTTYNTSLGGDIAAGTVTELDCFNSYTTATFSIDNASLTSGSISDAIQNSDYVYIDSKLNSSATGDNVINMPNPSSTYTYTRVIISSRDLDTSSASEDEDTEVQVTPGFLLYKNSLLAEYTLAAGETIEMACQEVDGTYYWVIVSATNGFQSSATFSSASPTIYMERNSTYFLDAGTAGLTTYTFDVSDLAPGDFGTLVILGADSGNTATIDLTSGNWVYDNLSGDGTEAFSGSYQAFRWEWNGTNMRLIGQ